MEKNKASNEEPRDVAVCVWLFPDCRVVGVRVGFPNVTINVADVLPPIGQSFQKVENPVDFLERIVVNQRKAHKSIGKRRILVQQDLR